MTTEIANPVWETECSDKYRPILEKICMVQAFTTTTTWSRTPINDE